MIYSSKNLSIAGLFAFAAFSPNNVDALPEIKCYSSGSGLYVPGHYSYGNAVMAEMNKVDGIGLSTPGFSAMSMSGCRASAAILNKFDALFPSTARFYCVSIVPFKIMK